jgi:hypothetical protein
MHNFKTGVFANETCNQILKFKLVTHDDQFYVGVLFKRRRSRPHYNLGTEVAAHRIKG